MLKMVSWRGRPVRLMDMASNEWYEGSSRGVGER